MPSWRRQPDGGRDFHSLTTPIKMDRRVKQVLDRLDRDFRVPHRVKDLASAVNLGASHLAHLMRREANTSVRDVIRRRRLIEAARLLATTHQRISEICYYVGFADVSNFNHAFRREFGLSPCAYRANRWRSPVE